MVDIGKGRVLVTGGAGFIGSALVWALNQRGIEDVLVSDFLGESEKWRNLVPLSYADYLEADDLLALVKEDAGRLRGITTVLHMGACSATTERDAAYLVRNNFEYTKALATWSLSRGIRFVYASSAATYGDGAQGMSDEADLESLRPLNMYGYSKQMFDQWAERQGVLDSIVGLKYFNVFGPNEDHKGDMKSLVHKAYHQVLETGSIRLFKSYRPEYAHGEQKRDFVYVKDAVAMSLHLAETDRAGGLYNIGTGRAGTWNELARSVFAALEKPERIEYIEMPDNLRGKYQYYTQAEVKRLAAAGWSKPAMSLRDSVVDYVRGYLVPDARLGDGANERRSA
ncbi:MAG: ADP-glyceromanno-heptose 6-epimerase [Planctomycetota bacterium]|nr:ADP-glyceromanno-heptose 6-epimerase [Planctomycetota bacterium]